MATFRVETGRDNYPVVVERGVLGCLHDYLPPRAGKIFVTTTRDVWVHHGARMEQALASRDHTVLFFPGGEERKRLSDVEVLAEEMVRWGADRSSVIVAFGGGIAGDMGGFLAAIFMRGIPVIQVPTTLLAQVDAAIGGKTGVNLQSGKNLIGSFHQPLSVLVDPGVLQTLPEREYRAGLFEVVKYGVIASPRLFDLLAGQPDAVLAQEPAVVDELIRESVRIKCEVVSADEKEGDLRRILNFGHTVGHALEAETGYARFLHGEAVSFGMQAATHLGTIHGLLPEAERDRILHLIHHYGPIPTLDGLTPEPLLARLRSDKKTIQGRVHFVLPEEVGRVKIVSGVPDEQVRAAVQAALA